MVLQVTVTNFTGHIDRHPDKCPQCHALIQAIPVYGRKSDRHPGHVPLQIAYQCPNTSCMQLFLGNFVGPAASDSRRTTVGIYLLEGTYPRDAAKRIFTETIKKVSLNFCEIYNEAYAAEQSKLLQICGVGYRKALEFLIKDYLKGQESDPAKHLKIETTFLGRCIDEMITNGNVKAVAKRATWLGNDETHYVRKWVDKDLTDLKRLIDLTVSWIETEEQTKEALLSMPGP